MHTHQVSEEEAAVREFLATFAALPLKGMDADKLRPHLKALREQVEASPLLRQALS